MQKIVHIDSQISSDLHSDFRWALRVKGATAKDVLAELVQNYVCYVKMQLSTKPIRD